MLLTEVAGDARGTIPDLIETASAAHPDRTALIDGPTGASVSYSELQLRIASIATWLHRVGVRPGDRVAIIAPNVPPVAACALAAMRIGAAVTTLNPRASDHEMKQQLDDAAAEVAVTIPNLVARLRATGRDRILSLGGCAEGATSLYNVLGIAAAVPRVEIDPNSMALLPYSSGTTGLPKGVMLSHANLIAVCKQIAGALGATERDVTLAQAPFFHILGMTAELLMPLSVGATVVTPPSFDPERFVCLLEHHRVTYIAIPPPITAVLATHPIVERYDLSALRFVVSGGAPLAPGVHEALSSRLPGCAVGQGWGLTETTGLISLPRAGTGAPPGTVGQPVIETDVRVCDPDSGTQLAQGVDGELWARGPQVMLGYLNRPAETRGMIDIDGWLRTGDLGHVDDSGNIVIVDRLKDLIKVNAFQVAPAEVEAALVLHPEVRDAAVASRPDARTGEAPIAFVVSDSSLDISSLEPWLADRLAPYKWPVEIHRVHELPRAPSGKLLRRQLSTAAGTGSSRAIDRLEQMT